MRIAAALFLASAIVVSALAASCGDDDSGDGDASPSPAESGSPTPPPPADLFPPIEGPDRGPAATERTDFRQVEEWQLPEPDELEPVPEDEDDAVFHPPEEPQCDTSWIDKQRPTEGFAICYPPDWQLAAEGFVSEGAEDRWYSVGIIMFADDAREDRDAHVSVYAIPRYARPMVYTRDCPKPYSLTFAGQPAVICPDFPGEGDEERIVSYHVRRGDMDYFIQAVPFEDGPDDAFDTAVQIAHTFRLIEITTVAATSPSP
jgi:hypothetical protein